MDISALYAEKLTTPDDAVSAIPSGSRLSMGMYAGEPPALLNALAQRAEQGEVGDLRVYYYETARIAGDSILRYELNDRIKPYSMFITGVERALIRRGMEDDGRKVVNYVPSNFHQAPRLLADEIGIDTFVHTVSPMDQHGYFSFGTGNDYSTRIARSAQRLILEVNRHMPRVQGDGAAIHISEVDVIVENDAPLIELPTRAASPEDETISRIIAGLVPDGACLQMGVGALPNLVCAALGARNDLGIHTEALNPGLVELVRAGVVTNRRKNIDRGKSVFTFAMGQRAMYDYLDDNPSVFSRPVDYVNDPRVIAQNDNVVSINATLQIDLTGACNSEHMLGHQYSASGGQLDFVRGAYASKGGRSIIAARSTAAKGTVSRIVPRLDGPVTTPRIDTHFIVTEYGSANLKGLSSTERALRIIELAHPDFRDELTRAARKMHLI
ncbi:acetyl-CoA hydrolase/transferase family protein [Pantoea cypripedii]|uniref:4-hydroxybutyrate--acetyl-CoA CoA transferase n=1 Tax=Pantoea cypripedii TaxID=55209 RepID=A0A6B9G6Z7_PANCY|nr:acetyl-CoA hydrolase/transferase C-terminal domain-containing protein [Pantoea cypripedii]QGY32462.1 4-hydroxybutyrate--acetyl-CoA CoA transferase [Pantoea cypripedii]